MVPNHFVVLDEIEKIFKRLEPNLLISYDQAEAGLGLILTLGRTADIKRRLSRVPSEEVVFAPPPKISPAAPPTEDDDYLYPDLDNEQDLQR